MSDTYPIPGSRYVGGYIGVGLQSKTKKHDKIFKITQSSYGSHVFLNVQSSMSIHNKGVFVCFPSPRLQTEI